MSVLSVARAAAGSLAFRAAVTIALLVAVFSQLDWAMIGDKLRTGHVGYGALAVLAVLCALLVGALRWRALLDVAEVPLPRRELIRIYAATSFANAFLPSSVGGDVARPLMVSRKGPKLVRAITTVLIERVAALVALVGLAWVGAALAPDTVSSGALGTLGVISAAMAVALLAVAVRPPWLRRVLGNLVPARLAGHFGEAAAVVKALRQDRRVLLLVMAQSGVFQVLVTIQLVLLAKMISVDLSFGLAAVALALTTLAMLIPISIGGFGVREGSYVVVLAGGGIGHTDAVLISLLSVLTLFIATLPGAFELVRGGFKTAIPEPSA